MPAIRRSTTKTAPHLLAGLILLTASCGGEPPTPSEGIASSQSELTVPPLGGLTAVFRKHKAQDYDGDGLADLIYYHPADGTWNIHPAYSGHADFSLGGWGYPNDVLVPGNYDGDYKTDVAVWRPSEGNWYVWSSKNNTAIVTQWGLQGDVPVPADYDGDGQTDYAVFRPSESNWYILSSRTGGYTVTTYGSTTDRQVPADYDGDGKADIAYFTPSNGEWHILSSRSGAEIVDYVYDDNGNPTNGYSYVPVPGDYDGDGQVDPAVYGSADGVWRARLSSFGYTVILGQWGVATDRPVPADYDGDGTTDMAVFRPSEGSWWVWSSKTWSPIVTQWGQSSDMIPYSMFSSQCGGFKPDQTLAPPYFCSVVDIQQMLTAGWPSDPRRWNIVNASLWEVPTPPSPNQPESKYVEAIGLCDKTAQNFYNGGTEWCSEFAGFVYSESYVPDVRAGCNIFGCTYLYEVSDTGDFETLFKARHGNYSPGSGRTPLPGDYLEILNSSGSPHSIIIVAVGDDLNTTIMIQGNKTFPINSVTHHCVTLSQVYLSQQTLVMYGDITSFF
jgi:hypothetical protein